jgi:Transposase
VAHERLTEGGWAPHPGLAAGDPACEVGAAYRARELLREVYATTSERQARRRLERFYAHCHDAEVVELRRLAAATVRRWEHQILASHGAVQRTNRSHEAVDREDQAGRARLPQPRELSHSATAALRRQMGHTRPVARIRGRQPRLVASSPDTVSLMLGQPEGAGLTSRTDLMQFWDAPQAPPDVEELMESWRTDPQFVYHRYCWESAHAFIRDHFDGRTLAVFESCTVPAMQCDVFRLCWLFEHGGAYVDADQGNRGRNDSFTDRTARGHLFRSPRSLAKDSPAARSPLFQGPQGGIIANGILSFFNPRDPLVAAYLERVSANIERRINLPVWRLTGPEVICGLYAEFGPEHELFDNVRVHSVSDFGYAFTFGRCDYKASKVHWKNITGSLYR